MSEKYPELYVENAFLTSPYLLKPRLNLSNEDFNIFGSVWTRSRLIFRILPPCFYNSQFKMLYDKELEPTILTNWIKISLNSLNINFYFLDQHKGLYRFWLRLEKQEIKTYDSPVTLFYEIGPDQGILKGFYFNQFSKIQEKVKELIALSTLKDCTIHPTIKAEHLFKLLIN